MYKKIKEIVKNTIGQQNIDNFRGCIRYIKILPRLGKNMRYKINDSVVATHQIARKGKHVFCGYFDITPNCPNNPNMMLIHIIDKAAAVGRDEAMIAIANISEDSIELLSKTMAWSWQMGARARWGNNGNIVYFNDYEDNKYVCKKFDIRTKSPVNIVPYPLYDISRNEQYGLTINFSRLQRLRPGYGYANIADKTSGVAIPENDGLFLVDMETGTAELLVSYRYLNESLPFEGKDENYINHIKFSPDSKKAMFFYLWTTNALPGWKATLWVVDIDTKECKCLEATDQVSHYTWKDEETLLITGVKNGTHEAFYRYYDIKSGHKQTIEDSDLARDGHPTFSNCGDRFYSDTYPNNNFQQELFMYENGKKTVLATLFHDPRMFGEKRCDLHPHYFVNREAVAVDTTCDGNVRRVVVVDL